MKTAIGNVRLRLITIYVGMFIFGVVGIQIVGQYTLSTLLNSFDSWLMQHGLWSYGYFYLGSAVYALVYGSLAAGAIWLLKRWGLATYSRSLLQAGLVAAIVLVILMVLDQPEAYNLPWASAAPYASWLIILSGIGYVLAGLRVKLAVPSKVARRKRK